VIEWPESDFRADYARLGELRAALPGLPFLALSATPTPSMWGRIRQTLQISQNVLVSQGSIYRPNLVLKVKVKAEPGKPGGALLEELQPLADDLAREALSPSGAQPTIIYTYRILSVEDIRSKLEALLATAQRGVLPSQVVRVGSYHGSEPLQERHRGDLSPREWRKKQVDHEEAQLAERERTQLEFIQGRISVVVANEAFGMGINHKRIRRVIEYGPPRLLEQLLNHFGRAGRDGKESICTLICKPQDFNIHESYISHDHHDSQKLTAASQQRQLGSLRELRAFSENVSTCRWRFLLAYWEEDDVLADKDWRCGKCDNCLRLVRHAGTPEKEKFDDVALLLLVMLRSAIVSTKQGSVRWQDMKEGLKRKGGLSELSKLKDHVDELWGKGRWTQPRLRHMLSVLSELPLPLVHRSNSMRRVEHLGRVHRQPVERYSLTDEGSALLKQYDRNISQPELLLPIPLFHLQHHATCATGRRPEDEDGFGNDDAASDEEVDDHLEVGQREITKHGVPHYLPHSIVSERRVGKRLEYRVRWQKWDDLTWEGADSPTSGDSSPTWRHTRMGVAWEAAKSANGVVLHVCLQLSTSRGRTAVGVAAQLILGRTTSLSTGVPPSPATSAPTTPANLAAMEQRASTKRAADTQAAAGIVKVPWAVQFALLACDASSARRPDIEVLARDASKRKVLDELSDASGQVDINHITTRHRQLVPRLRVPPADGHSALIYAVVVGPSALASASASASASSCAWTIIRYEGPFRRR
jgi:hypothetical protein